MDPLRVGSGTPKLSASKFDDTNVWLRSIPEWGAMEGRSWTPGWKKKTTTGHTRTNYFDSEAAGVDLADALGDQVGHVGARLRQVLRQVDAERRQLARQPLVAALDRQTLQAFLVAAQSALQNPRPSQSLSTRRFHSFDAVARELGYTDQLLKDVINDGCPRPIVYQHKIKTWTVHLDALGALKVDVRVALAAPRRRLELAERVRHGRLGETVAPHGGAGVGRAAHLAVALCVAPGKPIPITDSVKTSVFQKYFSKKKRKERVRSLDWWFPIGVTTHHSRTHGLAKKKLG